MVAGLEVSPPPVLPLPLPGRPRPDVEALNVTRRDPDGVVTRRRPLRHSSQGRGWTRMGTDPRLRSRGGMRQGRQDGRRTRSGPSQTSRQTFLGVRR